MTDDGRVRNEFELHASHVIEWKRQLLQGAAEVITSAMARGLVAWRQMSMRGLAKARGEWPLVTMAWNIKRLHVLHAA